MRRSPRGDRVRAWQRRAAATRSDCRSHSALDEAKLNVDGGAIAIRHPVDSSGAQIVLHLLSLRRTGGRRGWRRLHRRRAGGAMLVERL
jgi:acetyl-CoA acetyltransferase